ncbi:hypothetical protein NDN08_005239 [Rhodosorus marinus]|uniref:Trafficking protein particle complex subunit n=1 Tax=Rhodosorus marinus TaxID=101924 RepID=A0AAV8V3J4_9RHOD|nr:hypothetical protein NDN08_005239 [Rhodosorus marinus]
MPYLKSFFVVNKAGGLIFHRSFSSDPPLRQNDYLHLASTFHGMQLMVNEVSPTKGIDGVGAIEFMETSDFVLRSFYTATKVQFFVTGSPKAEKLAEFLKEAHLLYADYIMKNPFYEMDMPIKCELWDIHLRALVDKYNRTNNT